MAIIQKQTLPDRKKAVIEGFYALKAQAAAKANQTAEHARTMAGEYSEL